MRSRRATRIWRRKERAGSGPAPAQDRGTVLLMVIGVLALLAIIAVVYAAIGQGDRRTSTAYVRSAQVEDVSRQIADHVAMVIGKDTTATVTEEYPGANPGAVQLRVFRPHWTYPAIERDDDVKSRAGAGAGQRQFRPWGGGYQPWLAPLEPTALRFGGAPGWVDPDRQYLNFRDWETISNVVPNGQFVNLFNLRNNFAAEPGIGFDGQGKPRMSQWLTTYGAGGLMHMANNPQLIDGTAADLNVPWHWTALQQYAARPMQNFNTMANQPGVGTPEYYGNMWFDADGDGIADSRPFELAGVGGAGNVFSTPGLTQQDRARYFAAVRVVDLSGMINVNTATDGFAPAGPLPTMAGPIPAPLYPAGVTPSDIDLRRFLTLQDVQQRYGVAYDELQRPSDPQSPGNYVNAIDAPGSFGATAPGLAGYGALRWAIQTGRVEGLDVAFQNAGLSDAALRASYYRAVGVDPFGATFGRTPSGRPTLEVLTASPFGLGDEAELHAFFSLNNPGERSRLESVLDGQSNKNPDIFPGFGPLRGNRGLEVERERRGDGRADGHQDNDSLALQVADRRHGLTTISSSRPLTSQRSTGPIDPSMIGDDELRVNLREYLGRDLPLSDEELKELFNLACDAVFPYRTRTFTDNVWDQSQAANRGLHYGGSADFAFRSIAHWMVNLIDSSDDDNAVDRDVAGPTVISLRSVANVTPTPTDFPWPEITLNNDGLELAPNRTMVESQVVNIYGIEAQPFLCEVGSYAIWLDLPQDASVLPGQTSPDDEYGDSHPLPPPDPGMDVEVTMDGSVTFGNSDFVGEMVAFQVTNPFDRDLYLTRISAAGAQPEFLYYVEYAGRFFPLAEMDETASPPTFMNVDLKLEPGESRVFYATSPRREFNFNERVEVAGSSMDVPTGSTLTQDFLREFVDRQFRKNPPGIGQRVPVHTTMFDPATGALIDPTGPNGGVPERGLMDLHGEDLGVTDAGRKVINLWRVLRTSMETAGNNNKDNDLLADRLRDPSTGSPAMRQRLDLTTDRVSGTVAGDDRRNIDIGGGNPVDNTGLTVVLWGAVRRPTNPTDPNDSTIKAPLGAMPPWTLELREDQEYGWDPAGQPLPLGGRRNLNKQFIGPSGRGNASSYGGTDTRYRRFRAMILDLARGDGGVKINDQLREKAEDKKQNAIPVSHSKDENGNYKKFNQQAVRISLGGKDTAGSTVNAGLYKRAGDMLLPLAIGPYSDPQHPIPALRRMTLSEALALATDYFSPQNGTLYSQAGHSDPTAATPIRPKLDQGHFVIDDFVPYNDVDRSGTYNPTLGNAKERPLGLGIPMALNLLDKFRFNDFGGKTRGEAGKLSINSATLSTLSMLPMAAPDPLSDWITQDDTTTGRKLVYDPAMETYDVAATWASYREKIDVRTRPRLNVSAGPRPIATPAGGTTIEVSFRDTVGALRAPWNMDGRQFRTGIPALHEQGGFRSVGEVLAAVLREVPAGVTPQEYRANSVDRFAHDGKSFEGQFGLETTLQHYDPTGVGTFPNDGVIDDYAEKLAVASSVIDTVTVRSDTFCVYFVVQGYLPTDVENLGPNDPLIPSVAKRYMMIVDRSNVVKEGDKPRILMLREVPM